MDINSFYTLVIAMLVLSSDHNRQVFIRKHILTLSALEKCIKNWVCIMSSKYWHKKFSCHRQNVRSNHFLTTLPSDRTSCFVSMLVVTKTLLELLWTCLTLEYIERKTVNKILEFEAIYSYERLTACSRSKCFLKLPPSRESLGRNTASQLMRF